MSHEQYRYEHDPIMGDYVLKHGNRVLFRATSLAVCYSEDTEILGIPGEPAYTLLKHGNSDQVLEHAHKIRTAYREAGFPNMASEVVVVLSDLWDVETLNKIISTSGYLGRFIREQSNSSESQTQPQYQAADNAAPKVVRNSTCQLSKKQITTARKKSHPVTSAPESAPLRPHGPHRTGESPAATQICSFKHIHTPCANRRCRARLLLDCYDN